MADDGLGIVLAEAQRNLERQEASLESVRGRAVTLLGVASVVSGLASSGFISTHKTGLHLAAALVALALFAASVVISLLIQRAGTWTFSGSVQTYIDRAIAGQKFVDAFPAMNMAADMQEWRDGNQPKLERLYVLFNVLCIITGLEVAAWALAAL